MQKRICLLVSERVCMCFCVCVCVCVLYRVLHKYAPLLLYFAITTGTVLSATVGAIVVTVVVCGMSAMKQE